MGLVFAKFKAAQTILVLSKADQVTDTLFERLVVPRLLGADEETPRFGFAGCLATYCRDQATDGADRVALAEAGPRESEWARKRLSSLRQPPDALEKLRDNITVRGWAGRERRRVVLRPSAAPPLQVGNLLRQLERIYYNRAWGPQRACRMGESPLAPNAPRFLPPPQTSSRTGAPSPCSCWRRSSPTRRRSCGSSEPIRARSRCRRSWTSSR